MRSDCCNYSEAVAVVATVAAAAVALCSSCVPVEC